MRDEIIAYKRERILEEAVSLFYARGFTGTTLDDIAAELGVTKPFIYTHFKSKNELLAAVCLPTIERSVAAIENAEKTEGTPTKKLRLAIADFARVILERQPNIAIFFREEKNLAPEALAEIIQAQKRFDRLLSKLLTDGVEAGEFDIPDVSLAALAIGGMISWSYTWHRPNGRLPVDELCDRMAAFALQMSGVRMTPMPG
jgi:AcrR family transcriptional regulator